MLIDQLRKLFLIAMGVGLVPVALSYGALPEEILTRLYGFTEPDVSTRHVLRALMGLYLGMITFWLAGALHKDLRIPALWTVFLFVSGIGLGRVLSLVLDGWPQPLFVMYLVAEIMLAAASLFLIVKAPRTRGIERW